MTSIRSVVALAVTRKWAFYHMDMKNAFLNDDLSEVVYMMPPPGIDFPPGHVCRLRSALYGLKQARHAWFEHFRWYLLTLGYI